MQGLCWGGGGHVEGLYRVFFGFVRLCPPGHAPPPRPQVCSWGIEDIQVELNRGNISEIAAAQIRAMVLKVRGLIGSFYDHADQPVPFVYHHFVYVMSAIYLPMFSYEQATTRHPNHPYFYLVWDLLVVFSRCFFVLGLEGLADKLQRPLGADLEDLSVLHYVSVMSLWSRRMLEAKSFALDEERELQMWADRPPLGRAFEHAWGGRGTPQDGVLCPCCSMPPMRPKHSRKGVHDAWATSRQGPAGPGSWQEADGEERAARAAVPAAGQTQGRTARRPAGTARRRFVSAHPAPHARRRPVDTEQRQWLRAVRDDEAGPEAA